ncbi:MAG: general secretion pathway protein GspK [Candidatus Omnitrophica bacterium]|nr:general secretion pathway protein GspK [Candidatus Omnitrophota bacterium]
MKKNSGVVLIFVLAFTAAISLLAMFLHGKSKDYINTFMDVREKQDAVNIAEAGVEIGKALLDKSRKTLGAAGGESFTEREYILPGDIILFINIEDENSKINPSMIFNREKNETNTLLMETFKNLFTVLGWPDSLPDSLLDWIDEDDIPRTAGAESFHYKTDGFAYVPPNRNLYSAEEMLLVKNFTVEAVYGDVEKDIPGLINFITSFSDGKINVNTCPPMVLSALGFPAADVERITAERAERQIEERFLTETNKEVYTKNKSIIVFKSGYFIIRASAITDRGIEKTASAYVKKSDKTAETVRMEAR